MHGFLDSKTCWKRFYAPLTEVRAFHVNGKDKFVMLVESLDEEAYQAIKAIHPNVDLYATLNPIKKSVGSKRNKQVKFLPVSNTTAVKDLDIESYRWLFVDLDPVRLTEDKKQGVSSSEKEKSSAFALIEPLENFMREKGFHDPVVADSGNGYHLFYRIDMPNNADSKNIIKRVLFGLQEKFENEFVKVDLKVYNPSRINRLHGTMNRKGENSVERPHRKSGFLKFPEDAENKINSKELLESVMISGGSHVYKDIEILPASEENVKSQQDSRQHVLEFLDKHEISYWEEKHPSGEYKIFFEDGCPFNSDHKRKEAGILIYLGGKIVFKCFHNSCDGKFWADFVKLYEPDYLSAEERKLLNDEILDDLLSEYGEESEEVASKEVSEEPEKMNLTKDSKGKILQDIHNFKEVLRKDPKLKNLIGFNVLEDLPYNMKKNRPWCEADDSNTLEFLEVKYKLNKRDAYTRALDGLFEEKQYNPVQNMLNKLEWDGKPRIRTALHDYLGSENTEYVQEVSRLIFLGAVKRALEPGCKYDYMVVLIGTQGCGKSTFCRRLALEDAYFTDGLRSVGDKDSLESLLGNWIVEWGEMSAMKRAKDANAVKNFISQNVDKFRPAYGRYVRKYPRRCIFVGTTNDDEFLTDVTGNRRFVPVIVSSNPAKKDLYSPEAPNEFRQMMAEAMTLYKKGEQPYISENVSDELKQARENVVVEDPRVSLIRNWIEKHPEIDKICIKMIQDKVLAQEEIYKMSSSAQIGAILSHKCNLVKHPSTVRLPVYGVARVWTRDETWKDIPTPTHEDELAEGQYELDKLNYEPQTDEFEEI